MILKSQQKKSGNDDRISTSVVHGNANDFGVFRLPSIGQLYYIVLYFSTGFDYAQWI